MCQQADSPTTAASKAQVDALEAVDETPVRPELELLHHVLQVDQIADIQRRLVVEALRRRIEVEQVHRAAQRLRMRDERGAERRLACSGGTRDEDGVTHAEAEGGDEGWSVTVAAKIVDARARAKSASIQAQILPPPPPSVKLRLAAYAPPIDRVCISLK